jgi:hypothetical protein
MIGATVAEEAVGGFENALGGLGLLTYMLVRLQWSVV